MNKILIANRGEIALRIIRTAKNMGIETVAVYSEADANLPFVNEADESICIGKGPVQTSYLVQEAIIDAAKQCNVDGIHPGYGLLSENAEFAKRVVDHGFIFIGPSHETIRLMGDKVSARQAMEKARIPVVPGSNEEIDSLDDAIQLANKIGYPIMLKASNGGGGVGMVICHNPTELEKNFQTVKTRAKLYFGSEKVFIEKFIENGRHIEIQVACDEYGNHIHLFERDCSIQRRNQKVIEEALSPSLKNETRSKMYEAAIRAAAHVQYKNVGTVEFIVDENEEFYFLEMNTRLQVEHPVTEVITGIDLVELQIKLAQGEALPINQNDIKAKGHSIEFRIYAEHPETFLPSPGKITTLKWGNGDVRIDFGYVEGNTITPFYDPMIAKCIFNGTTREECLSKAKEFFQTTEVTGIKTNIPLFIKLLDNEAFVMGDYSTNLLHNLQLQGRI